MYTRDLYNALKWLNEETGGCKPQPTDPAHWEGSYDVSYSPISNRFVLTAGYSVLGKFTNLHAAVQRAYDRERLWLCPW